MTGSLLQLMTLVTHGNSYLLSGFLDTDFYPSHPIFQGCAEVIFSPSEKSSPNPKSNLDPNQWFSALRQANCQQLYLHYASAQNQLLPEHLAVAFANGGGSWHIVANFDDHANYWSEHWEVNEFQRSIKGTWIVKYNEVAVSQPSFQFQENSLENEHRHLSVILEKINNLAIRNGHHNFADFFQRGLTALHSDSPTTFYLAQGLALNKGYSLQAKQIIIAACESWVFGGMGSWNDIPIKENDTQEYLTLSRELYALLNICIERGINSYKPNVLLN